MTTALEFSVEEFGEHDGGADLLLATPGGVIRSRLHRAAGREAIVWVSGAGGGLGGPAGGLYERLARVLQAEGVGSLQVAYRRPGAMRPCVEDALTGSAHLQSLGAERVVLVGHSFGGAVVINAGAAHPAVIAVAALSSQSEGAVGITRLSPKPLMLMHGEADEVLPPTCSVDLYRADTRAQRVAPVSPLPPRSRPVPGRNRPRPLRLAAAGLRNRARADTAATVKRSTPPSKGPTGNSGAAIEWAGKGDACARKP